MSTLGTVDRPPGRRPVHRPGLRRGRATVTALVAVVVLGAAAALWAGSRPDRGFDPATPQGVVQAYVRAVVAGDSVSAAGLLAPGSPCAATDLDRVRVDAGTQVDLVGAQLLGDRALVRVSVADAALAPVPAYGEQVTIRLVRNGSGWLIDGIPWPLYECTGG